MKITNEDLANLMTLGWIRCPKGIDPGYWDMLQESLNKATSTLCKIYKKDLGKKRRLAP